MPKGIFIYGKKVAQHPSRRYISQTVFAQKMGVSPEKVKNFEPKEIASVSKETIPQLAKGLGISIEEAEKLFLAPEPIDVAGKIEPVREEDMTPEDLKREADAAVKEKNYTRASRLYSLLSNDRGNNKQAAKKRRG